MDGAENDAKAPSVGAQSDLPPAERQAYETRIAKLERARASVDQLARFQIEAYKARIVDLKQALARERFERQAAARELAALKDRHDGLVRRLRALGRPAGVKATTGDQGEKT